MKETDCLRVNLMGKLVHQSKLEIDSQFDIESDYDGSDLQILPDYDEQFERMINEREEDKTYQDWLIHRDDKVPSCKPKPAIQSYESRKFDNDNYIGSPLWEYNTGRKRYQPTIDNNYYMGGIK